MHDFNLHNCSLTFSIVPVTSHDYILTSDGTDFIFSNPSSKYTVFKILVVSPSLVLSGLRRLPRVHLTSHGKNMLIV